MVRDISSNDTPVDEASLPERVVDIVRAMGRENPRADAGHLVPFAAEAVLLDRLERDGMDPAMPPAIATALASDDARIARLARDCVERQMAFLAAIRSLASPEPDDAREVAFLDLADRLDVAEAVTLRHVGVSLWLTVLAERSDHERGMIARFGLEAPAQRLALAMRVAGMADSTILEAQFTLGGAQAMTAPAGATG